MSEWQKEMIARSVRADRVSRLYLCSHRRAIDGGKWEQADEFRRRIDEVVAEFEPTWDYTPKEAREAQAAINSW